MSLFITGAAGSGKTTELLRRAAQAAGNGPILLTSSTPAALASLAQRAPAGARVCALHEFAAGALAPAQPIDEVRAAELFEDAAQPLFTLSWVEFIETDLDFEIPGLRAPQRFAESAFRLFCKLRDALITPDAFMESAQRGATQFYAKPPNLAGADLLHYTKETYRDSLAADPAELNRQFKHEIDLAKILTKLYRTYLEHPVRAGCLTPRDTIAQAVEAIRAGNANAGHLRLECPQAFIDDAQELTVGELVLLQSVYGETLEGVTLAFDRDSTTGSFRGARPDRVAAIQGERVELLEQRRNPFAIDLAARHLSAKPGAPPVSTDPRIGLQLFRATTQTAEAQFIADHTVELLKTGTAPDSVALLLRSDDCAHVYRDALLDRGIPVQVIGDLNVFTEPQALDALAVLWCLYDPFRHDYLLRVLQGPLLALSDATVQTLCANPPDMQTSLFNEPADATKEVRAGRWDAKRDLRLGLSVLRGDRDADLSATACLRLQRLRSLRSGWLQALRTLPLPDVLRVVWSQGLARDGAAQGARAQYQQQTLERLLQRATAFASAHDEASLGEFLEDAERRMHSSFETAELQERPGAVRIISIDAARGREFDHVIVPNARAGSFPRWYVPDAFLYSPSLGMIAKENVGEAVSSRTAKFTYYMWRTKARESYNLEERRAFVYALRRARVSALVTACGRPTRGVAAPEFLAELQAARLPGVQDFSDRWRPSRSSLNA